MEAEVINTVFLSHTTKDDAFVASLRARLEGRGYEVLEDSQFVAGEVLPDQIRTFIDRAPAVIAVGSGKAAGSHWVRRELRCAKNQGKRIVPLIFDDGTTADLRTILDLPQPESKDDDLEDWPADLIGIRVPDGAGSLDVLMPALLDALEGRGGGGKIDPGEPRRATPVADLVLQLRATRFELVKDARGAEVRRPVATASLAFFPPGALEPAAESDEFDFAAPLGKIEAGDLRFYLERYFLTPYGNFAERARGIEAQFPEWGQDLWEAIGCGGEEEDPAPVQEWRKLATSAERRFTVQAPPQRRIRKNAPDDEKAAHRAEQEAATEILGLPWELLRDESGYLFHDGLGARVRRSLPGGITAAPLDEDARKPPLRVLAVCARPEKIIETDQDSGKQKESRVGYIDHRVSVRPLTEALNALGELAEYEILSPPTFPALCDKLRDALAAGRPYHVVHFDGHGVFDKTNGLGALVFEHPEDAAAGKLRKRRAQIVSAGELGEKLRNAGVGLFFLEACQSAQAEASVDASVAGRLLQSGIGSVAAMSHSVLVETARRFTAVFYPELAEGARVGAAMLKGQIALEQDRKRGWGWAPAKDEPGKMRRRPLELHDWFVPVLYQDGEDPPLLAAPPHGERVREELEKDRTLALGNVPEAPEHAFVGRSRELLAAERLLVDAGQGYAVFRGEGGEGKTTLAAELARWLVATRRFPRAAFASVEKLPEDGARAVLANWGSQLVPNFAGKADTLEHGLKVLTAALRKKPAVLMLDNLETILPPPEGSEAAGARVFDQAILDAILKLCDDLLRDAPRAKILFTSREFLPADSPFGDRGHVLEVGRLGEEEGMELVARVLAGGAAGEGGGEVNAEALRAEKDEEIAALVTAVNGHARSLVLLTPELARRGLQATAEELAEIMAALEARYPGERERSLFASLELSLRRLPGEIREKLLPLAVFQGGGNVQSIAALLQIDTKNVGEYLALAAALQSVGLAEILPPENLPFIRFDPALAPALLRELREKGGGVEAHARARWAGAYGELAGFLYQQQSQDAHLASSLTLLELPNLLGALNAFAAAMEGAETGAPDLPDASPETVIDFATRLEGLLQNLGRRDALAEAEEIRARAAEILDKNPENPDRGLTHEAFLAAFSGIQRLLGAGRFGDAVTAAKALVERCEAAPDDAFPLLEGDRANALITLGRAQKMAGDPRVALNTLAEARGRYESLAETMNDEDHRKVSAHMASVCLTDEADCLGHLGQLDAAASKYADAIELAREQDNPRQVATGTIQLGTVRLRQRRFDDALTAYFEARDTFEKIGEPRSVATAWHQIGMVYEQAGQLEEAEGAYQSALNRHIEAGFKPYEASSRLQLGNLYNRIPGRREEAIALYLQAADIYAAPATADPLSEGLARSNAASSLVALGRLDEAREPLNRALECKSQFGANSEPWKTWSILHDLETAAGNLVAAAEARALATAAYAAARREGWQVTQGAGARLCGIVRLLILANDPSTPPDAVPAELRAQLPDKSEFRQELTGFASDESAPAYLRALASPLLAILDGSRDPALAGDPALYYADAAELQVLLEQLGAPPA